ncbi:unnamed protein product [Chrysodeixis includens]|uniref:Peptidase S1 domain-containing protein n=1 Tax=Chrysodeixis includens TaxID=689277 RepID=A0A9P0C0E1_CHRIL|nr:unnamed protein product [Chrysodeixis includens]
MNYSFQVHTKTVAPEGKIIGGQEAQPHSHPYLVSLQSRFLWARVHACGGAILNERWVLSAAHCAIESWLVRWLPLDVVAGIHDVNTFGVQAQVIRISERIPHPLYEGGIGPYDIGVFGTSAPFFFNKFVQPVKLPLNYKMDGDSMKLAGWGALKTTIFIPDLPSRLQEVKVTYMTYQQCHDAIDNLLEYGEVNPLDEEANMCTGPITGGVAACSGDSGGPLIQYIPNIILEPNDEVEDSTERYNGSACEQNNEQTTEVEDVTTEAEERQYQPELVPVVVGVVSWGVQPCGERGAPTVYTNISTYIDFITYNMNVKID